MAKFDLHLHSNNSDGSESVENVIKSVINSGIEIFALTDHDTVAGINHAAEIVKKYNVKFIKGIELTCRANGIKCHILGYNVDSNNEVLTDLIDLGKKLRRQKLETRIQFLKDNWNIELTRDELDWLYSRKSVVKTHIANILVKRGLADNNVNAMKKYLNNCKTGNTRFDGETAIKTIEDAGGIPVWAHPLGGEGEKHLSPEEFLPKLKIMIECGIKGLECYYSRYSLNEIEFLVKCAKENNLLISGGSDWHGTNKSVPLGLLNTSNKNFDSSKITLLDALIY